MKHLALHSGERGVMILTPSHGGVGGGLDSACEGMPGWRWALLEKLHTEQPWQQQVTAQPSGVLQRGAEVHLRNEKAAEVVCCGERASTAADFTANSQASLHLRYSFVCLLHQTC